MRVVVSKSAPEPPEARQNLVPRTRPQPQQPKAGVGLTACRRTATQLRSIEILTLGVQKGHEGLCRGPVAFNVCLRITSAGPKTEPAACQEGRGHDAESEGAHKVRSKAVLVPRPIRISLPSALGRVEQCGSSLAAQADFFCGGPNKITFPRCSSGIHFVGVFLKELGT
jgi:hypothetical protein